MPHLYLGSAPPYCIQQLWSRNETPSKVGQFFLAILTFSSALLGTFLVRSGILTSVHAFATDPERGIYILLLFVLITGGSLFLYAIRGSVLKGGGLFSPISREGALVLNNLLLTTSAAVVLLEPLPITSRRRWWWEGLGWPTVFQCHIRASDGSSSFCCTIAGMMTWKRADLLGVLQTIAVCRPHRRDCHLGSYVAPRNKSNTPGYGSGCSCVVNNWKCCPDRGANRSLQNFAY